MVNLTYTDCGKAISAGRYKLALGSQCLIGPLEWNNVAHSFDGVRIDSGKRQAYAFKLGVTRPLLRGARLTGLSYVEKTRQTNLTLKHNQVAGGDEDVLTENPWFPGPTACGASIWKGRCSSGIMGAGDRRLMAVQAQVVHVIDGKTGVFVVTNAASGGSDSKTRRTFDTLYPTSQQPLRPRGHSRLAEQPRDLYRRHAPSPPTSEPVRGLSPILAGRRTRRLYNSLGGVNGLVGGAFVDPTGRNGRDIGSEFDFEANYAFRKNVSLSGGIATFSPRNFVRRLGKDERAQTFGYVQAQFRF